MVVDYGYLHLENQNLLKVNVSYTVKKISGVIKITSNVTVIWNGLYPYINVSDAASEEALKGHSLVIWDTNFMLDFKVDYSLH